MASLSYPFLLSLHPSPLKETFPEYIRHLTGAVNIKFKFILCTTFDFKADYTSVVKGGHRGGAEEASWASAGPKALLTPSNSLGLILVALSKGPWAAPSTPDHMCPLYHSPANPAPTVGTSPLERGYGPLWVGGGPGP